MKLAVLAASVGILSLTSTSWAQGDGSAMLETSRTPQAGAMSGASGRIAVSDRAPTLDSGVRSWPRRRTSKRSI